ncbi:hypothetical protein JD276_02015 [Leucobacter sp. CSA1]|uniref:histidine kinase n=1 Tax=Leucobacter chromiisoli TaxID=2796471 RepID=A0A934Q686_9MICO|nr:sensor histidine kinase [Leucobacter chromiisoli]MBK0417811.1 hypothetical protein [Leucobacter chromiisoli]
MTSAAGAPEEASAAVPLLPRSRAGAWLAGRPRIADVAVILACTAPTVAALILSPPAHAWLGYLCAAAVAIVFWWRRSHPLAVLLIAVGIASVNPIYEHTVGGVFFESVFGAFALAARTSLRVALLGYAASEVVILVVSGAGILLGAREELPPVMLDPAALIALALGVAVRANSARRAALEELVAVREAQAARAERARITAEMHDVVAHSVTVMIALAGGARAGWEKHPERARRALEQLGAVGAEALGEMQRILRVLRTDGEGPDRGITASGHDLPPLEELVEVFRAAGLPVSLVRRGEAPTDPALLTTVYRIVQESLTNALRHAAGASRVEVEVVHREDELVISVSDDGAASGRGAVAGAGIAGRVGAGVGAGVGLAAMRERVAVFGGSLEAGRLDRGPGWRTRATLRLEAPSVAEAGAGA